MKARIRLTAVTIAVAFHAGVARPASAGPTPVLNVTPTTLSFSAVESGSNPPSQALEVTNSGTGALKWSAASIGGAAWLSVSPTKGINAATVSVAVNVQGLLAGSYSEVVRFSANGAVNSPTDVIVTLTIEAPPSDPPPSDPPPDDPPPSTIIVSPGGSIQAAVDAAGPGTTILIDPGLYIQRVTLRAKSNPEGLYITLTTNNVALPEGRIDLSYKSSLATIQSPDTAPAIVTEAGASYYRLLGLAFEANVDGKDDIIRLGEGGAGQTTLTQVPHHFDLDRLILVGGASGQKRGIAANASDVVIQNSDISNIWKEGQDSQAICGWNTPGRITIRNNRLEAASENIMFGGADPGITNLVAADIVIEDNLSTKNPDWKGQTGKVVKNAFELKAARNVRIVRNIFERVWKDGQDGTAIVLKTSNSSGSCTECVTEDVLFEGNVVRHAGAGVFIGGHDYTDPAGQTKRITIRNNLFYDISIAYGGSGRFVMMGNEPRDITVDHNTVMHDGTSVVYVFRGTKMLEDGTKVTAGPVYGFVYTNNLAKNGKYGIYTEEGGANCKDYTILLPDAVIQRNVFAGATTTQYYPPDNLFDSVDFFMAQFQDPASHNYRLNPGSPYTLAGIDGKDLGADYGVLPPGI